MSFVAQNKGWTIQANKEIGSPLGAKESHADALLNIVKSLTSLPIYPWTVRGSSDSVTAGLDSVNRLTSISKFKWDSSGSAHSWIVLADNKAGFEVCIDCKDKYSGAEGPNLTIAVSLGSSFTGGNITTRPTATDEIVKSGQWLGTTNESPQFRFNLLIWRSNDGLCTRISCLENKEPVLFWLFDRIKNPITSVTKVFSTYMGKNSMNKTPYYSNANFTSKTGSDTLNCYLTAKRTISGTVLFESFGRNQYDGKYFIDTPVIYCVGTSTHKGKLGELFDLYWGSSKVPTGTVYDEKDGNYIQLGNIVLPWDPTILLVK